MTSPCGTLGIKLLQWAQLPHPDSVLNLVLVPLVGAPAISPVASQMRVQPIAALSINPHVANEQGDDSDCNYQSCFESWFRIEY